MRADRLLAELLLLRAGRRWTAADLAAELEVSQRTVYRDMYALQVAGVPVVVERGRGGGYSLYGGWRSDASGLSTDELAALALAAASWPAGAGQLRTAVVKLASSLPDPARSAVERLQARVHIDPSPGPHRPPTAPLNALTDALRMERQVALRLRRIFTAEVTRTATVLGLVAWDRGWHLVWAADDERPRVDRVEDVLSARVVDSPAWTVSHFDLARFWTGFRERTLGLMAAYEATVRALPALLPVLERTFGHAAHAEVEDERVIATLPFASLEEARSWVLGWGGAVEVLSPEPLRRSVADHAARAAALYR